MSTEENTGEFDPDTAADMQIDSPPNNDNGCMQVSDLQKVLDIDKFNDMMAHVTETATNFLTDFMKSQQDVPRIDVDLDRMRYRATAIQKLRELRTRHNNIIDKLEREHQYLTGVVDGYTNSKNLYSMLKKENEKLKKVIEGEIHTIEISDRKTYYENEQNSWAGWWSHHFKTKYWLLIFLIIIAMVFSKELGNIKKWGILIALILYPILAFFLLTVLGNIYSWIKRTATWVYL